jgi:glycerol-3-phosphate acyltransferase PlsY
MDAFIAAIVGVAGYLIGSVSMARVVVRLFAPGRYNDRPTELNLNGTDKTMHLNTVSATSVSVQVGSRLGFMTYVLDVLKIFIPTVIIKMMVQDADYFLLFAATGMVGHIWPIYYRFRGGRGISAAYAGLLAISPLGFLVCSIGGMLFGLLVMRDMWMAYCAGVWAIVPWLWFRTGEPAYIAYAVFINIVFMLGMIPETKRWFRIRRENKWNDTTEVMQLSGMGRGLLKMARKLGIVKKSS